MAARTKYKEVSFVSGKLIISLEGISRNTHTNVDCTRLEFDRKIQI